MDASEEVVPLMFKLFKDNEIGKNIERIFWPIAISIFLSNMLGFIDSAMVANYSTISLNGINIANQIKSIFGPMYFGILSGLAIFTAQAVGKGDKKTIAETFGFGLVFICSLSIINFICVLFFSKEIINFFVDVNTVVGKEALTFLRITIINTIFWPISMLFMYQFRSIQRPKVPMYINTAMLITNLVLNLFLIYGIGPVPELGIAGAGIGTVLSVGIFIFIYLFIGIKIKAEFIAHPKIMFGFTKQYGLKIIKTTIPLILIELLFGASRVIYTKMYISLGIESYTLITVSTNITNLVNSGVIATASTAGIVMGEALGKKVDLAPLKNALFSFMKKIAALMFVVIAFILPFTMFIYKPNDIVIEHFYMYVYTLMVINGIYMVIRVFSSTFISILKSGGNTKVVILADPFVSYAVGIPFTAIGLYVFGFGVVGLKLIWLLEIIGKLIISYSIYKKNKWAKSL